MSESTPDPGAWLGARVGDSGDASSDPVPPRRPRPTPMSEPWAFDDEPPPRQAGLAVGMILVVLGWVVVFIIALVLVDEFFRALSQAL
jgi:hypothetical protein